MSDEFLDALGGEPVERITHPGPLNASEVLTTRSWYDERRRMRRKWHHWRIGRQRFDWVVGRFRPGVHRVHGHRVHGGVLTISLGFAIVRFMRLQRKPRVVS